MNILGYNITDHTDSTLAIPYKKFAGQLSKWYNKGEMPVLASQDLRYILELQRKKLQSMGLDMQCKMGSGKMSPQNISSVSFSDRIFTNSIISGDTNMTITIGNDKKTLSQNTMDIDLIAVIQNLKENTLPSPDMPICCPNCGAASTIGKLESGCKYCDTKFLVSELYPKVMNYFIHERYDRSKRDGKNLRDLRNLIAVSFVPLLIVFLILGQGGVVENIFSAIICAVIIGGALFLWKKLFETLGLMGNNLRGAEKTGASLYNTNKIKKLDPEFSTEYFRDKVMSLFRMVAYSQDTSDLVWCRCQRPENMTDIIEAQLFNFSLDGCSMNDNTCDADVTLYLDCLHYRKGKIVRKADKYKMRLRKRIKGQTDFGFSFAAVNCPSCGGSFDARNVKACPYCDNEYLHEENDWVITEIK
ncbi:MAG: hypothetical protein IJ794_14055 [Lachnospiraceae bacterium]|nr:hypothetical protein [Lachnospiraceae bacterium]MBR1854243.1 hypothetical protein [Lachnospiraceae bacterium]